MKRTFLISLILVFAIINQIQAQEKASALSTSLWKHDTISVCWEKSNLKFEIEKEWVKEAIENSWEKHSVLFFSCWCDCNESNKGIRITITDTNPHTNGLGNQLDGKEGGMVLNFTFQKWGCTDRRGRQIPCTFPYRNYTREDYIKVTAVHEFGHGLGFAHEQNRDDCKFPNCDKDDRQGTNGDWYITACDTFSVMNYCNPYYSNHGKLSELDIEGLTTVYGHPSDFVISPDSIGVLSRELRLAHTSTRISKVKGFRLFKKRLSHKFKVYLVGDAESLDEVDYVVYHLHPTFKRREIKVTNRTDKFGLGLTVWGEFNIKADVIFKDGSKQEVERFLSF